MSLTPLCLALAVAVLLPSSQAFQCHKCMDVAGLLDSQVSDDKLTKGAGNFLGGILGLVVPQCKDFDPSDDRFKEECKSPNTKGCVKSKMGDVTVRGCQESENDEPAKSIEGCVEHENTVSCICQGELCNGAPAALPGLLLLLPAALALLRL